MNRKTFLATIAALFAAPFVKGKEKQIEMPEADKQWINANPELLSNYERATWTVKGSDLQIIMKKQDLYRRRQG